MNSNKNTTGYQDNSLFNLSCSLKKLITLRPRGHVPACSIGQVEQYHSFHSQSCYAFDYTVFNRRLFLNNGRVYQPNAYAITLHIIFTKYTADVFSRKFHNFSTSIRIWKEISIASRYFPKKLLLPLAGANKHSRHLNDAIRFSILRIYILWIFTKTSLREESRSRKIVWGPSWMHSEFWIFARLVITFISRESRGKLFKGNLTLTSRWIGWLTLSGLPLLAFPPPPPKHFIHGIPGAFPRVCLLFAIPYSLPSSLSWLLLAFRPSVPLRSLGFPGLLTRFLQGPPSPVHRAIYDGTSGPKSSRLMDLAW